MLQAIQIYLAETERPYSELMSLECNIQRYKIGEHIPEKEAT